MFNVRGVASFAAFCKQKSSKLHKYLYVSGRMEPIPQEGMKELLPAVRYKIFAAFRCNEVSLSCERNYLYFITV